MFPGASGELLVYVRGRRTRALPADSKVCGVTGDRASLLGAELWREVLGGAGSCLHPSAVGPSLGVHSTAPLLPVSP